MSFQPDNNHDEFEFAPIESSGSTEVDDNPLAQCHPTFITEIGLTVPPIEWVYGATLIRGMLTILGGVGGVGKTSYALKLIISIALGHSLLNDDPSDPADIIYEPGGKVWYYSLEDPIDMLQRKVNAELIHHQINPSRVADKIALRSGRDAPLVVAKVVDGQIVRCDLQPIINNIKQNGFVVLAIDPFANSFEGQDAESNSDVMKIVLDQWRQVAHEANCAILLVHHFRKGGQAGDADAFRGSSTIQNAARVMETMATMSVDDAKLLGIDEADRRSYVEMQNAKVNFSAAPACRNWYRFRSVKLHNASAKYPKGDSIGVLARWRPTEKLLTAEQARTILDRIDHGEYFPNGKHGDRAYFTSRANAEYSASSIIIALAGFNDVQAKKQVQDWLDMGLVAKGEYRHPKDGKARERLMVNGSFRDAYLAKLAG